MEHVSSNLATAVLAPWLQVLSSIIIVTVTLTASLFPHRNCRVSKLATSLIDLTLLPLDSVEKLPERLQLRTVRSLIGLNNNNNQLSVAKFSERHSVKVFYQRCHFLNTVKNLFSALFKIR